MILRDILAYGGIFALDLWDNHQGVIPLRGNLVVYAVTLDLIVAKELSNHIRYIMPKNRCLSCFLE